MSKVLNVIEAVFGAVQSFAKANPALAATLVSELVLLLAHFGLNVSAGQLAAYMAVLSAILGGLVHVSTKPRKAGEHESGHDNLPTGLR